MHNSTTITRCKAGETEAFDYLVRKCQSETIGHAMAILGSLEDAFEAVLTTFLDAHETLGRFDVSRRFYP